MAGNEKETAGNFFREVEAYVVKRSTEFQQIPPDRKRELEQLAAYVRTCIKQGKPANLTFICTHNSRRSHLTQVWAQIAATYYRLSGINTFSGGTEATACNSRTVEALKRCGVRFITLQDSSTNPHYSVTFSEQAAPLICYSKIFNQSPNPDSGYCAVMTCSHADQNCPVAIGCDLRLAIRYEDPKVADDTPAESATYDERCAQIAREMLYAMYEVEH